MSVQSGLRAAAVAAVVGLGVPAAAAPPVIVQVAAGDAHTCALDDGGQVWCWGDNQYGQLGDGSQTDRLTPVAVAGLSGVEAVALGGAQLRAPDQRAAALLGP